MGFGSSIKRCTLCNHSGGLRVPLPSDAYGGAIDVVATVHTRTMPTPTPTRAALTHATPTHPAVHGHATTITLEVSLANLNAVGWCALAVNLTVAMATLPVGTTGHGSQWTLQAQGFTATSLFDASSDNITMPQSGQIPPIHVPPLSVVHITIHI